MKLTKGMLDCRICDIEECENTQTYREFIMESEIEFFGGNVTNLDNMTSEQLTDWLEELDYLWTK